MKESFIIDADAHIRETPQDYISRMPPEFDRQRFSLFPSDNWDRFMGRMGKQVFDMETYLGDMDIEGIDVAVLYPTSGLSLSIVKQPDLAKALARAWNDFIGETCATHPRLRGVAMVFPLRHSGRGRRTQPGGDQARAGCPDDPLSRL